MRNITKFYQRSLFLLGIVATVFLMQSCEKAESVKPACEEMLYFEDVNELSQELNTVLAMTHEERLAWQEKKGFKSLGVTAEEFYRNIDPENFKSTEELKLFVSKNSEYLQLVEEDGEFTLEMKLFKTPIIYLANEDAIFQIGDSYLKIFENGIASTSLENLEMLSAIDEQILIQDRYDNSSISFSESINKSATNFSECSDPKDRTNSVISGRTRISISFEIAGIWNESTNSTYALAMVTMRPQYRTLGVWFLCSRRITYDVKCIFSGLDHNGVRKTSPLCADSKVLFESSSAGGSWFLKLSEGDISNKSVRFEGIDGWAMVPGTDPYRAEVQCNTSILY